jgi:A/G-specific adenine glycosylase
VAQVGDQPLPHGGEPARLAPALLRWHARHGRHDLPWQHDRSPYRVWVSEIMLQQTQVATVIGYYARFMARFPSLRALAEAPEDEVLHLWSGLGYYSRARNLQRAARQAMAECGGELPASVAGLAGLPGIGPSTAAAIRALSAGERATILDGNVRRVLARYFALAGPLGGHAAVQHLWALAEACTPHDEVATYTQAIMDLGATVCLRARPLCTACPLAADCAARRLGLQASIPARKPRPARRTRATVLLLALSAPGAVLLERQPARGVWGGLWCPPQFTGEAEAHAWATRHLAGARVAPGALAPFRHVFTHFDLEVTPLLVRCAGPSGVADSAAQTAAGNGMIWYSLAAPPEVGLPAPVSRLLAGLASATGADPDTGFLRG